MKIDVPILKRLGPVPFWRGQVKCLGELQRMYLKAMEAARRVTGQAASEKDFKDKKGNA